MAVLLVPRPLQERLGDAATDSLIEMFREAEANQTHDQEQQRKDQQEHLFVVLEERFLRHVAESESLLRKEIGQSESLLRKEIGDSEGRLRKEIGDSEGRLRKEIGDSEGRLRTEMNAGFARQQEQLSRQQEQIADLGKEIEKVRTEFSAQIGVMSTEFGKELRDVHKRISDVHQQIAVQTRWLLTVLVGAAVLIPVLQRVMGALLPS
jgi:hypothetical protein